MTPPTVTFVMPAHNAAKFIREAIDSIRAQTVTHWHLIVVNDGSTDATAGIVREYASADSRIRCVDMPAPSGSAFSPRRRGIELAQTEFVAPLDADDYIPRDYLRQLLHRLLSTHADAVYPTMYGVGEGFAEPKRLTPPEGSALYGEALPGKECVKLSLDKWNLGANGGIIRRELYLKACNEIPTEESSRIYTDELHTRHLLYLAPKVCSSEVEYFYRVNDSSVTHLPTARAFENYYTNRLLIGFCRERFGEGSEEYMLAHRQNFHWIFGAMRRLTHESFSASDRKIANQFIEQAIANVDFALIKPHVSPRYYALLRTHRIIPTRPLLALIDKVLGK